MTENVFQPRLSSIVITVITVITVMSAAAREAVPGISQPTLWVDCLACCRVA